MLLRRFGGPNGIFQMIALLESSSDERCQQLLTSLAAENPGMASLLKTKVLTVAHIFAWDTKSLEPIFDDLALASDDFVAGLMATLKSDTSENGRKLLAKFSLELESRLPQARFERIRQIASSAKGLCTKDGVRAQFLAKVRELERTGKLHIESFDPPKAMTATASSANSAA